MSIAYQSLIYYGLFDNVLKLSNGYLILLFNVDYTKMSNVTDELMFCVFKMIC